MNIGGDLGTTHLKYVLMRQSPKWVQTVVWLTVAGMILTLLAGVISIGLD